MTARRKRLRLFVWRDVLCDYSCGAVVVLAKDAEAARQAVLEAEPWIMDMGISRTPEEWDIYGEPRTLIVHGGG